MLEKLPELLLPWFAENRRDLPWRKDRHPYHVWLSEIMLQQTRVEAVKGYYDRFLAHYRGGTVLLCREKLIREEIPLEPRDMPVPWVLTERGLYEDGIPARLG